MSITTPANAEAHQALAGSDVDGGVVVSPTGQTREGQDLILVCTVAAFVRFMDSTTSGQVAAANVGIPLAANVPWQVCIQSKRTAISVFSATSGNLAILAVR
jgi:hypothetical protein